MFAKMLSYLGSKTGQNEYPDQAYQWAANIDADLKSDVGYAP